MPKENWEKLTSVFGSYPVWSQDGRCIYFNDSTVAKDPEYRICLSDRKLEVVANMVDAGPFVLGNFWQWTGVSPDGPILAARDISLEEIYSAELDLP